MAKVVGLSGAQGGGKSTLLTGLAARGWRVDDFRVSRAVQAQLGWERLDKVMEAPDTMTRFQRAILDQKLARDLALQLEPTESIILTERTFADIAAYATLWTWKLEARGAWTFHEASLWLGTFMRDCLEAQDVYAATLLLNLGAHVSWQDDPNRADRASADQVFEDISNFTGYRHQKHRMDRRLSALPRLNITAASVPDRITQVEDFLNTL